MLEDKIKTIKIGNIELENNILLAPMAGVTDIAFRKICKAHGTGLVYTEMASSKALVYNDKRTSRILDIDKSIRPNAVQIFGSDVEILKQVVLELNKREDIDIIDINMGCPAPKIVKNGDGAALLKDLNKVEAIIKAITEVSTKPITVKTRKGVNEKCITAIEVAKICEKYGVAAITIHGRTLEQHYTGKSDLDIIKQVKEAVSIPVIGNGDVVDRESALKMFEYTNCDAIMIGRGAEGNPWIFDEILNDGIGKKELSSNEIIDTVIKHIDLELISEAESVVVLKMRKHIAWYLKGLKNTENINSIKQEIYKHTKMEDVKRILNSMKTKE